MPRLEKKGRLLLLWFVAAQQELSFPLCHNAKELLNESKLEISESGYMTRKVFNEFLDHFTKHILSKKLKNCLKFVKINSECTVTQTSVVLFNLLHNF